MGVETLNRCARQSVETSTHGVAELSTERTRHSAGGARMTGGPQAMRKSGRNRGTVCRVDLWEPCWLTPCITGRRGIRGWANRSPARTANRRRPGQKTWTGMVMPCTTHRDAPLGTPINSPARAISSRLGHWNAVYHRIAFPAIPCAFGWHNHFGGKSIARACQSAPPGSPLHWR